MVAPFVMTNDAHIPTYELTDSNVIYCTAYSLQVRFHAASPTSTTGCGHRSFRKCMNIDLEHLICAPVYYHYTSIINNSCWKLEVEQFWTFGA